MVGQGGPPVLLCFGGLTCVCNTVWFFGFPCHPFLLERTEKIRLTSLIHAPKYVNAVSGHKTPQITFVDNFSIFLMSLKIL